MVKKRASFPCFRSVKSQMMERYIFNFRMRPDDLARKLPVPWLTPQAINGWCAVSFCILWLERVMLAPLPALINFKTISCAYRIGVIDTSGSEPEPWVYITDRWADLAIIPKISPLILLDTIPLVNAAIGHAGETTHVQLSKTDGNHLFSAETQPTHAEIESEVFGSIDQFAQFIKEGVSSYAPSLFANTYSKVDLKKEDVSYEALNARIEYSALSEQWNDVEMIFDSAVRAKGAGYKWTYRGLWEDK